MARFETVLFDLDGTLIDSVDLIVDSYHHTFRVHELPARTREEILAGIGTPLRSVFGKLTDDADTIERWIDSYREFNLAHHDQRVRAYPGVIDMIRALQHDGYRLGLVTSKNRSGAERGLALIGLADVMEVIIGADDVANPKPHPEPVQLALQRLAAGCDSCVFIGDSHHDVHCGKAAGVTTVGVTWGPFDRAHLELASPDAIVASPDELLTWIRAGSTGSETES